MWYEQYKKLNSALFTHDNSARGEVPPFVDIRDDDLNTIGMKGMYGMDQIWGVVGYTESVPFPARGYEAIGIMFEDLATFEKKWWHYPKL